MKGTGSSPARAAGNSVCTRKTRSALSTCGGGASRSVCRTLNMLATAPTPMAVVRAAVSETALPVRRQGQKVLAS